MPRVPVAPPPGIFRGGTPAASAGRWWDANNIRFRQGQAMPVGGNVAMQGTDVPDLPRDMITWHDNSGVRWGAFGTDTKLYAYQFTLRELHDITPAGVGGLEPPGARVGYGLADYGESSFGTARDPADIGPQDISASMGDMWGLDTFGERLLILPTQDGRLYEWDPNTPTVLPILVPEAPINNRGVVVTDQRSVVLLAAGGDPRRIAWSDQEDYHVWTPAVANLAGDKQLQTQSYAMRAIKVGQGVLIWTGNDLHLMSYVGPPYAYGINMIASGCGPMSPRAIVQIGNNVIWPGVQTFWSYSGSVSPMPSDIQDWFFSLVNREQVGRVFGSPNPTFSEAWWDWPDEGATECNRYVAVNYGDQGRPWTIGVRSRTCADPTGTMDYPILGGPNPGNTGGCLYLHEYGMTENGLPRGGTGATYLESGAIALGEGDRRYHVRQVALDSSVVGPADLQQVLGWRFFHSEQSRNAVEHDTGTHTEQHDGLLDIRFSGRFARVRVEALSDEMWAIGRPRLIIRQGGKR
jgi:hypothetical protein